MSNNTTPVIAIPIVDTSGSMVTYNYVAITKIDTKAFLSNALPGDYIGVASYNQIGTVSYPLTIVDQALSVPATAAKVVENLSFGGTTNIGGGLQTGVTMLNGAPSGMNKGLVLLSDGYQNTGQPPIPLPVGTPPVYSCAMGPNSDQKLMKQIAELSNGKYYYAPYIYDMMQIYNNIRAQSPGVQLLVNDYKNATPFDSLLIPANISLGNDLGQFSVVWSDPSYQFVNGQPGLNQLSVTLVNPQGTTLTPMPSIQGGGYVVFNIPNPQAGQWYIQIMYGGDKPIGMTGGAFEYSPNSNAVPITLKAEHPESIKVGEPLDFSVHLKDGDHAIVGHHLQVTIIAPKISKSNALKEYATMIKGVTLSAEVLENVGNINEAKLYQLHQKNLPKKDLLPHVTHGLILTAGDDGTYRGHFQHTLQAGSYNIKIQVSGHSEKSNSPFSRSMLTTVLVTD